MFHTNIKTSHFNLIACASATQQIAQGDEPLGIITALLCTGATSISGTMWEVQLGTGRDFIKYMYKDFCRNDEGSVVDLAVALQKTVKKLKRSPDTREPFHWAPFVLHGSWFRKE
jgi:CHAT domain-containing protein